MSDTSTVDPAVPEAAPLPASASPAFQRFRFTGNAREYFGIWIVNLFLTVVTLGIYSAWAKVRKKQYLYANTWIAGANFEYHGQPYAILRGRLLAFAAFVAYTLSGAYSPKLGAAVLLAILVMLPWLLTRTFAFNAANSSYRNIRFRYAGRWTDTLGVTLPLLSFPVAVLLAPPIVPGQPIEGAAWLYFIGPASVALFYPYIIGKLRRLLVNRSSLGMETFGCEVTIGRFYGIYFVAGIFFMILAFVTGFAAIAVVLVAPSLAGAVAMLVYGFVLAAVLGYTQASIGNAVWGKTWTSSEVIFSSDLKATRLAWIYVSNLAAIVGTLGLAVPWAVVRTLSYRADCLAMRAPAGVEAIAALPAQHVTAFGEEMGSMFNVDIAL